MGSMRETVVRGGPRRLYNRKTRLSSKPIKISRPVPRVIIVEAGVIGRWDFMVPPAMFPYTLLSSIFVWAKCSIPYQPL